MAGTAPAEPTTATPDPVRAVRVGLLYIVATVVALTTLFYTTDEWWIMPAATVP